MYSLSSGLGRNMLPFTRNAGLPAKRTCSDLIRDFTGPEKTVNDNEGEGAMDGK